MCEIFGFSGNRKKCLNEQLKEFFSHSKDNPDGWGMALFDGNTYTVEKEGIPAVKSDYLKERLEDELVLKDALAHIRLATIGTIRRRNSHPFCASDRTGRRYYFVHNGTIFESEPLVRFSHIQKGDTDSERILLYMIDEINRRISETGEALDSQQRFSVMEKIITDISPHNKLNLLLFDGELLYVHTNYHDSLFFREEDDGVMFATVPLGFGQWEKVPMNTLFAYENGQLKYTGKPHENEFIPDAEKMKLLYLDYSGL